MRTAFAAVALVFLAFAALPSPAHAQAGMGRRAPTPTQQDDNKKQEEIQQQQQQPQQDSKKKEK